MISERFHGLELTLTGNSRSSICYLLMPTELPDAELQALDAVAHRFSVRIAVISGMNWNNDLTPWTATGLRKKEPDFGVSLCRVCSLSGGFAQALTWRVFAPYRAHSGMTDSANG